MLKEVAELEQEVQQYYGTELQSSADLKTNANVNFICRNIFARCDSTFLHDGQIQKTSLNAVTDRPSDKETLIRPLFFEPIPIDEIGPYESN